jgi:hypothetical protein
MSDIGRSFGLSPKRIGCFLKEQGLRDETGAPSMKACEEGYWGKPCGYGLYGWHERKIAALLEVNGFKRKEDVKRYVSQEAAR